MCRRCDPEERSGPLSKNVFLQRIENKDVEFSYVLSSVLPGLNYGHTYVILLLNEIVSLVYVEIGPFSRRGRDGWLALAERYQNFNQC